MNNPNEIPLPPTIALSIRQPWAWLIAHNYKHVENRTWPTGFRGPFWIHAGKGMSADEYEEAFETAMDINPSIPFPKREDLQRGGIVGQARINGCTRRSSSPWFFGPWGFLIADAKALPFRPCPGKLGFFPVTP